MTKIIIFSLIWYFAYLIITKIIAKIIRKDAYIIAENSEKIENKEYTKETANRVSLKITPPIAIIICFIPILNILFDILLFIWLYMELLVLVAMKNTKANL